MIPRIRIRIERMGDGTNQLTPPTSSVEQTSLPSFKFLYESTTFLEKFAPLPSPQSKYHPTTTTRLKPSLSLFKLYCYRLPLSFHYLTFDHTIICFSVFSTTALCSAAAADVRIKGKAQLLLLLAHTHRLTEQGWPSCRGRVCLIRNAPHRLVLVLPTKLNWATRGGGWCV